MMGPAAPHFAHAKRQIHNNTSVEITKDGALIMTDGKLNSLSERHIAHNALVYLLNMVEHPNGDKPVLNKDFTVEELGTNASQDMRRFKVTIFPPYVDIALEVLKEQYYIENSQIKGLEHLSSK